MADLRNFVPNPAFRLNRRHSVTEQSTSWRRLERAAYFSGECIDEDIGRLAVACMTAGETRELVYGARSDVIDLPLPCGGRSKSLL